MPLNKELYKMLFDESCRGMHRVQLSDRVRYELNLVEPSRQRWNDIRQLTGASNQEMDEFFQAAKGQYYVADISNPFPTKMSEILAGEHFSMNLSCKSDNSSSWISLLKLTPDHCLVTDSKLAKIVKGTTLIISPDTLFSSAKCQFPQLGEVQVDYMRFFPPTTYHRTMDMALLPKFRKTHVAENITAINNYLIEMVQTDNDLYAVQKMLTMLAENGISTYSARVMMDTATTFMN